MSRGSAALDQRAESWASVRAGALALLKGRPDLASLSQKFDPDEPRDEAGRWTDSGGGGESGDKPGPSAFVSPNIGHLSFDEAQASLSSPRQKMLAEASRDIDTQLGQVPALAHNVIGAWADGAENSLMLTMPGWSANQARVALAMKGYIGDQKSALLFTPDPKGQSYLANLSMKGNVGSIHENLLDAGLTFHTIEPTSGGAVVHIYGDDQATLDAIGKVAKDHDSEIQFSAGRGEFIGTTKQDGSDREQRDDARREYDAVISAAATAPEFAGRDLAKTWDAIRAGWGGKLSELSKANRLAFAALKAQSLALLREFDPDEPRDESGKWTDGGGSGGADKPEGDDAPKPHPEAIAVGGDAWNKQTAVRLEHEYVAAHEALDKIAEEAVGGRAEVPEPSEEPDDEDQPFVPEEWDQMGSDQQSEAEDKYKEQTYQSFLDSEIENWSNETKPDDARAELAWKFTQGDDTDWAQEALNEYLDQREEDGKPPLAYDADALLNALTITHDTGNYPISKGTDVAIDDAKLEPDLAANQPSLPGMEGVGVTALTAETKAAIIETISEAFGKRAEEIEDTIDPPSYLSDSVAEYQGEMWDQMDDGDKFNWVKNNTDIIEEAEKAAEGAPLDKLPTKFDPLEEGASAQDYKRTQMLARTMSVNRAAQLLVERGLIGGRDAEDFVNKEEYDKYLANLANSARQEIAKIDNRLWSGWKSSSTNDRGQLLQVATAEELGGRLYEHKDLDRDQVIADADKNYKDIGGFKGVEAYVRAKWETSQYLLDEAGVHTLQLYRAINIREPPTYAITAQPIADDNGNVTASVWAVISSQGDSRQFDSKEKAEAYKAEQEALNQPPRVEPVKAAIGTNEAIYEKLPDLSVKRNGAASTSTHASVSNAWDGSSGRVVLRAEVPRTAVVSVPAYGINVHSEHEVVVAGTAWKAWDAWKGRAPEFEAVPLHKGEGIAA